jgi:hypothetical protein
VENEEWASFVLEGAESCHECVKIFEEGDEYYHTVVEREDEADEMCYLCEDCYRDFLKKMDRPFIKEPGGNDD